MKPYFRFVFFILLFAWLIFLPVRSMLYVYRVFKEFKNPPPNLFQAVKPCDDINKLKTYEEVRILNYKKLGEKCEK